MIYSFFRVLGIVLGYPLQWLFFKRKTYYEDKSATNLKRGGRLIISNHYNMFDYVMACFLVFPRKLTAIASELAFKNPFLRFGVKFFGAIKADRVTKDMRFMDEAAEVIRRGGLVQIFPEGRNTPDGEIHEFKQSYLVIAHRAGAPIVPVISDGNYGLFRRVHVIIGREIDVSEFFSSERRTPTREELARANEAVHAHVLELRRELERRKSDKKPIKGRTN